jgi:hypothetical protein
MASKSNDKPDHGINKPHFDDPATPSPAEAAALKAPVPEEYPNIADIQRRASDEYVAERVANAQKAAAPSEEAINKGV